MVKSGAIIFGAIFLLLGVLGLVPDAQSQIDGIPHIFGIFAVDAIQNIIHLASGTIGLLAASSRRYSRWYLQIFGIAYTVIAIAGLAQGDTVLGLFGINTAGNFLHAVLAAGLLACGFGLPTENGAAVIKPPKRPPAQSATRH